MAYGRKRAVSRKRSAFRKRAAKVSVPRLRRIIGYQPEVKFLDTTISYSPISTSFQITGMLGPIVQGATANTRVGNRIFLRWMEVTVMCEPIAGATFPISGMLCRFGVVHAKEVNNTNMNVSQIWYDAALYPSARNSTHLPKYRIVRDMTHSMVPTAVNAGTTTGAGPFHMTRWRIPVNKTIVYSTSGSAGSLDLVKDDFGFFSAGSATGCNCVARVKLCFNDM